MAITGMRSASWDRIRSARRTGQPRWEVRAFLPHADAAAVVVGGDALRDGEEARAGLLRGAAWMANPSPYQLRAHLWDGREVEIDDPYRFGPQISESDLYLHAEGTLYEAWRRSARTPW